MRLEAGLTILALAWASPLHALPSGDLWKGLSVDAIGVPPVVSPAPALDAQAAIVEATGAAVIPEDRLFELLAAADIVYVGERHDHAGHHLVQAAALEGVHARKKSVALGLEMADITQQKALDEYSSGAMTEEAFADFWRNAWGFDFGIYRPVLAYARANGIPIVALNAPRKIVSQVAKGGLASLTPEQRALIPDKIGPIKDPRYLAYVRASLGGHGPMPPEQEARMLEAMQVWNETMGRSAVQAARRHGTLVVIAGSGHMLYRGGIPECAADSGLKQSVVLPYPADGESIPLQELLKRLQSPGSRDISLADFFWLLPGTPGVTPPSPAGSAWAREGKPAACTRARSRPSCPRCSR